MREGRHSGMARRKEHAAHRALSDEDFDLKTSAVAEMFDVNAKTVVRWVKQRRVCADETPGGQYRIATICIAAQRHAAHASS